MDLTEIRSSRIGLGFRMRAGHDPIFADDMTCEGGGKSRNGLGAFRLSVQIVGIDSVIMIADLTMKSPAATTDHQG
jgi:hypothetical protein